MTFSSLVETNSPGNEVVKRFSDNCAGQILDVSRCQSFVWGAACYAKIPTNGSKKLSNPGPAARSRRLLVEARLART
jgi:hypothetical protein